MEVQTTDFENAAFTCTAVLLSRVMLFFDLNLYMPLSLVEENFRRAHVRNAVNTQRFHFRRHFIPSAEQSTGVSSVIVWTAVACRSHSKQKAHGCNPHVLCKV